LANPQGWDCDGTQGKRSKFSDECGLEGGERDSAAILDLDSHDAPLSLTRLFDSDVIRLFIDIKTEGEAPAKTKLSFAL
jgi:hypothetical protein